MTPSVKYILTFLSYQFILHHSYGHSWVACTDYTGSKSNYDASKCRAQPRYSQNLGQFGSDIGFDFRPPSGAGSGLCQEDKWSYINQGNLYGPQTTAAEYSPGQKVTLAFPGKNHGKIPDRGIHVYRSGSQQQDNSFASVKDYGLVKFEGSCSGGGDKDLCTMEFELESDLQPGVYSFRWVWEFNRGEFYATCWEGRVGGVGEVIGKIASVAGGNTGYSSNSEGNGFNGASGGVVGVFGGATAASAAMHSSASVAIPSMLVLYFQYFH